MLSLEARQPSGEARRSRFSIPAKQRSFSFVSPIGHLPPLPLSGSVSRLRNATSDFTFAATERKAKPSRYFSRKKQVRLHSKCQRSVERILGDCARAEGSSPRIRKALARTEDVARNQESFLFRLSQSQEHSAATPRTVPLFYKNFQDRPFSEVRHQSRGQAILAKYGCGGQGEPEEAKNQMNHPSIFDQEQPAGSGQSEREAGESSFAAEQLLRREVEQIISDYKREKYSFVYGSNGQGRFLSQQGFDMIEKCDQVLSLNPQYVFLAERISRIIKKL